MLDSSVPARESQCHFTLGRCSASEAQTGASYAGLVTDIGDRTPAHARGLLSGRQRAIAAVVSIAPASVIAIT